MKNKFLKLPALFLFVFSIFTTQSHAKPREQAPLKLESLQDVLDKSYPTFASKWLSFSLGEKLFSELDRIGAYFEFTEETIDIDNFYKTFRAYCTRHDGVIIEDLFPAIEKTTQSNLMTCETINPAKVVAKIIISKRNGVYTTFHKSGADEAPMYKYYADKNKKEQTIWKVGQKISSGLIDGVVLKVYDTKQVAIQPENKDIPVMISEFTNVFPIESAKLGQDIKSLSDLENHLTSDFHSFGKEWLPRDKVLRKTGAILEQASKPKYRVFAGYYPFSFINKTFQAYCSAHSGQSTLFLSEKTYELYCIDSAQQNIIAMLSQINHTVVNNESSFSFSANEDNLRTFKTLSKIRADNKNGFAKGEKVRTNSVLGDYIMTGKIIDADAYGYYVQTGIDRYKWIAGYNLRKDIDY
jgi:hypothetical protein